MSLGQQTPIAQRGSDLEGRLEMVNHLLFVALGLMDVAENVVTMAEIKWILREADRAGQGFFRRVESSVLAQQRSEGHQTVCLLASLAC